MTEDVFAELWEAETRILRHNPKSASEAVEMLSIIAESLESGSRSDGLDYRAANALKRWLTETHSGVSTAA